ncbi:hypothetical protein [Iningainema tapete]|uniref:Uncharacterized protein n=1 Tax=Iningainema tapete BLCC-T55 TaxID=2748662 RepID=A0A8J7C8F2_9CYAN|nr:hypothetical protein [Iningainema tapete]MBD2774571.1 hypothetical protein [Iningainema tapete BLCC-T55]
MILQALSYLRGDRLQQLEPEIGKRLVDQFDSDAPKPTKSVRLEIEPSQKAYKK